MHLYASNSSFVEHNGSQMNYSRMSLPGGCKQLMHHTSCMSVPQTTGKLTGKPTGMRGCCSLLTFPQLYLKTRVTTKVGSCLHFGLHGSSWCLPRDANNCDAWRTLMGGSSHMHRLAAPAKQSALWHQPKSTAVLWKWY